MVTVRKRVKKIVCIVVDVECLLFIVFVVFIRREGGGC